MSLRNDAKLYAEDMTNVYGTTNGFKNISPNTIIERDPYSNTTKVYGTTNGFKNISPKAIIEEDPYSIQPKYMVRLMELKTYLQMQ